ncbi:MAG: hypothetical protein NC394_00645 [Bacteroides sp.]|nr:hypothetical protein [Bacteroides sp.]
MKKCQFPMSMGYAIIPATLITVLPFGWIFYSAGTLSADVFITCVILSLGVASPLIAAMGLVDNLAQVGTTVAAIAIDELLNAEEQHHKNDEIELNSANIELESVRSAIVTAKIFLIM